MKVHQLATEEGMTKLEYQHFIIANGSSISHHFFLSVDL